MSEVRPVATPRQERDLIVRWIRQLRREPISDELRRVIMPRNESLLRRLKLQRPPASSFADAAYAACNANDLPTRFSESYLRENF